MVSDAASRIHALFLADMVSSPIDGRVDHSDDSSLSSAEVQALSGAADLAGALREVYPTIKRLESHVLELARVTLDVLDDQAPWICHGKQPPTLPELMNRFCAVEDTATLQKLVTFFSSRPFIVHAQSFVICMSPSA